MRIGAAPAGIALLVVLFTPWPEPIQDVRTTYLRGFPIVWGTVLAVAIRFGFGGRPVRGLGAAGSVATMSLLTILLIPWTLPEPRLTGPDSLAGLLTVVVLAAVVLAPGSLSARMLSWRPLLWFGARSYGLYLYHFPVVQVMRHQVTLGPDWLRMLLAIALSVLVTWASFRWVEEPFLRLKDRMGGGSTARPAQEPGPGVQREPH